MFKFVLRKWLGSETIFEQLAIRIKAVEKQIIHLPAPIIPPPYKNVEERYYLDAFKEGIEQYKAFAQQAEDTAQKITQIKQDIAQIQPELESAGYFAELAHGKDMNSLKQYLNEELMPLITAKNEQYEEAKKKWFERMKSLRNLATVQVKLAADKADLWNIKTEAEIIERDLDTQINNMHPEGLVSLTKTKMSLSKLIHKLQDHMRKYEPVHKLIVEAWNSMPFKELDDPRMKELVGRYYSLLTETKEIDQRIIEKLEKYVKELAVSQPRFEKETEEAKLVRNYPDLYFLHGVKTKGGEFWGHNLRTKFSNTLDAIEYNIKERPELAYSRSRDPAVHWFVVGLRAIDGEITVVDTSTKALESGERISTSERETFITDPITKEVIRVKYNYGGGGKDITKDNIINYPSLNYVSGQNEVSIKNPVFDGIWIDFAEILIEQGRDRFEPGGYGLQNKEQLIKGCQMLAKKYHLKLYAIYFDNIEEVNPGDDKRIKEIIAEARSRLRARGVY